MICEIYHCQKDNIYNHQRNKNYENDEYLLNVQRNMILVEKVDL